MIATEDEGAGSNLNFILHSFLLVIINSIGSLLLLGVNSKKSLEN